MAFVAAMNTSTKVGVNGEEVLTEAGVGDVRVSLFTMLNRGLEASYIRDAVASAPAVALEDLLVMAMQTRDIRGGKGERDLFYAFVAALHERVPAAVEALIPLVPEYGCWRDLWELYRLVPALRPVIHTAVARQWATDSVRTDGVSLLAKWLPREGSVHGGIARMLAGVLYPNVPYRSRMATYRKAVAAANRKLATVEVAMCEGRWSDIDPAHVPGRCFRVKHAALQNYTLKRIPGHKKRRVIHEERVGNEDRRQCAKNVAAFLEKVMAGKATIKGADVVQPNELVRNAMQERWEPGWTEAEKAADDAVVEGQWRAIREAVANTGGFGKAVPMCDFSGSMSGLPLEVSMALGILISETNHAAFRDHILTFDSIPTWHSFVGQKSLREKVRSASTCGHGLSTDFHKACMLILDRMKAAAVPATEAPKDLIVLTDMGWDAAHTAKGGYGSAGYSKNRDPWKSQVTRIRDAFAAEGYVAPRIVIWNLRAAYKDFHAAAEDDGVVMISGWSPNVLNALQKDGVQTRTPMEALRAVLDVPRYAAVREAVQKVVTV